jgi:hypothetical protein
MGTLNGSGISLGSTEVYSCSNSFNTQFNLVSQICSCFIVKVNLKQEVNILCTLEPKFQKGTLKKIYLCHTKNTFTYLLDYTNTNL